MDESLKPNDFTPPPWLVCTCRWLWARLHGWWSIGLSLLWNLVGLLLFAPVSPLSELTQFWAFKYKVVIVIGLLLFLCFTLLIGFMSQFETTPSLSVRRRHYLRQMILDHTPLKESGIPEIFFPPSIKLEDVFISLELIQERTSMGLDDPLREEEIPVWQRIFTQRKGKFPRVPTDKSFPGENVEIAQFWQCLSRDYPVAAIQGDPGMGKSTLMRRLTLHMARCCLKIPDPHLPALSPALVPLLIELKTYADAFKKAQENKEELPLSSYLPQMLQKRSWQGKNPWPFISRSLESGACLVLFDGLNELGDAQTRKQVTREINSFILEQRNTPLKRKTFNRFLVTSPVAGYSAEAFPDAFVYRIAELTAQRMHDLLKLWYRAVVKAEPAAQEAEERMQHLHTAIDEHGSVFRLAKNPLLLMLMAAMQKYGISLPIGCVELSDTIMLTLLKYYEKDKDLQSVAEFQFVNKPLIALEKMRNVECEESWSRVAEAMTAASITSSAPVAFPTHVSVRIEKTLTDNDIFFFNERLVDPQEFFGRKQEQFTLIGRTRKGSSTSIVGPRRIGKTWLIEYLIQAAPTALGPNYRIGYLNATMPHCDTVAGFTEVALESLGVPTQHRQVALNLKVLAAATKELREDHLTPILCIDEFEGFNNKNEFNLNFFRELRAISTMSLGLVVASKRTLLNIIGNDGYTSGFFNIFEACILKPFDEKEAKEFVQVKGDQAKFSKQERTLLLKYGQQGEQQWYPLRLQLAGKLLLDDKNEGICHPNELAYQQSFAARMEEKYLAVVEV